MLGPTFYTLPGNEKFVPSVSHPGEDAGADIRACLNSQEEQYDIVDARRFYQGYNYELAGKLFVDGIQSHRHSDLKDFESFYSLIKDNGFLLLYPGQTVLINSGFKISFPDFKSLPEPWQNFVPFYQVVSRSGLAHKHRVVVTNSPGIIDSGYQDWIKVSLTNNGESYHVFTDGSRIAQGIYSIAYDQHKAATTTDPSVFRESQRSTGGFGSTALT